MSKIRNFGRICALVGALTLAGCSAPEVKKPAKITPIFEDGFVSGVYSFEIFNLKEGSSLTPEDLGRLHYMAYIIGDIYDKQHLMKSYDINNDKVPDTIVIYDDKGQLKNVALNKNSVAYEKVKKRLADKLIP